MLCHANGSFLALSRATQVAGIAVGLAIRAANWII